MCRLYPLSFYDGILGLSDDYLRYSCAAPRGGTSVYRGLRAELRDLFGSNEVRRLDRMERQVLGRRLPVVASFA